MLNLSGRIEGTSIPSFKIKEHFNRNRGILASLCYDVIIITS